MHGWFCRIHLIHLIRRKSLHFEKKTRLCVFVNIVISAEGNKNSIIVDSINLSQVLETELSSVGSASDLYKPVMVSVVSSSPTRGNFIFLRHLNVNFVQKWQKCQSDLCYLRKLRMVDMGTTPSIQDGKILNVLQIQVSDGHFLSKDYRMDMINFAVDQYRWICLDHSADWKDILWLN